MTEKNNGGPAFPISNNDVITEVIKHGNHPEGMSLRDYFAARAPKPPKWWIENYGKDLNDLQSEAELISVWNYAYADAMIKEREK